MVATCGRNDRVIAGESSRVAKTHADPRTLGSAIRIFTAHMGALPVVLTDLTQATRNGLGHSAGPFIAAQFCATKTSSSKCRNRYTS